MCEDSICLYRTHARKWALERMTQHSLEVTCVAGDHLRHPSYDTLQHTLPVMKFMGTSKVYSKLG